MIPIPAGTHAAQNGADDWFTPGKFAALLGLLIIACFPQVVFGLETFYFRDYQLFGYPLAFYHREAFWRGEIPLWNPYNDCGLPFLAQWNTLTLYPLSLFYLLFPLPWSLGVFCLGHLFLAGMGMYFLAHRWTNNRLAAAVAGAIFAFNGLTWHSLMWPNDIAALGWMPWVVLAMEGAWRKGGRTLAWGALAGAMQMLAGAPEVIALTWVMVGALWLAQFVMGEVSRVKMVSRAGVVVALVAGLAAAQLLPFFELLKHSHRDDSFGGSDWAMPATGLGNYLVPLFHCVAAHRGVYMQIGQYWTSSYYVGVGVVALGLMAAWRVREWRVWLLGGLVVLSLLLALGDHGGLYPLMKRMAPQMGFMRFPIKFVVLATFVLPLLAAHGVAWWRNLPEQDLPAEWKRLTRLSAVLVGLIVVILFCAWKFPESGDDLKMTLRNGLHSALFLAAMLVCLRFLSTKTKLRSRQIIQTTLIVLFWMDVFTHVPNLSPTVPSQIYQAGLMRQYFASRDPKWNAEIRLGNARVMQTLESLYKMYWGGLENGMEDVFGRRVTLFNNVNLLDDIPKLDGFYSLYLREPNTVITDLYLSSNDVPHLKDFLGIARVNPATNALEWIARDTSAPLLTAGQQVYFGDDAHVLRFLFGPSFDGRKMVCLPPEADGTVNATNHGAVNVLSTNFGTERVEAEVEGAGPGMVVVAQSYYPAWHAYVDGQPTRLWRANYAFQALEVPAGRHQVEIVYQDHSFELGGIISVLSLMGCAMVWVLLRKGPQPAPVAGN
jgi:Bacterial membrane protein YfhO